MFLVTTTDSRNAQGSATPVAALGPFSSSVAALSGSNPHLCDPGPLPTTIIHPHHIHTLGQNGVPRRRGHSLTYHRVGACTRALLIAHCPQQPTRPHAHSTSVDVRPGRSLKDRTLHPLLTRARATLLGTHCAPPSHRVPHHAHPPTSPQRALKMCGS